MALTESVDSRCQVNDLWVAYDLTFITRDNQALLTFWMQKQRIT